MANKTAIVLLEAISFDEEFLKNIEGKTLTREELSKICFPNGEKNEQKDESWVRPMECLTLDEFIAHANKDDIAMGDLWFASITLAD